MLTEMSIRSRFGSTKILASPELPGGRSRDGQRLSSLDTGPYVLSIEDNRKGCAVQHQNAPKDTFATKYMAKSASGLAQNNHGVSHRRRRRGDTRTPGTDRAPAGEPWRRHPAKTFSARLDLLDAPPIPRRCAKCCKEVLLTIGTGALLR
jgi:hypothetical protein